MLSFLSNGFIKKQVNNQTAGSITEPCSNVVGGLPSVEKLDQVASQPQQSCELQPELALKESLQPGELPEYSEATAVSEIPSLPMTIVDPEVPKDQAGADTVADHVSTETEEIYIDDVQVMVPVDVGVVVESPVKTDDHKGEDEWAEVQSHSSRGSATMPASVSVSGSASTDLEHVSDCAEQGGRGTGAAIASGSGETPEYSESSESESPLLPLTSVDPGAAEEQVKAEQVNTQIENKNIKDTQKKLQSRKIWGTCPLDKPQATRQTSSAAESDHAIGRKSHISLGAVSNAAYIPTTRAKASESRHSLSDLDSRVAAQKAVGHAPSIEASPESRLSIAELIGRFERDIRSHEVPKPHSGPTRPVSPKLLTKARGAHHAASAVKVQRDEANAEEMKRQFKARPLDPRILEPGYEMGLPKVLPKSPTKPMNVKLAIDDRALSRQTKELPSLETEVKAFKARPVPQSQYSPVSVAGQSSGRPSVRHPHPTSSSAAVAESPTEFDAGRSETVGRLGDPVGEACTTVAAQDWETVASTLESGSGPTRPLSPKLAIKTRGAQYAASHSLMTTSRERFELGVSKESLTLETEVKAFKARPVPQSQYSPVSVAGQSSGRPSVRHPHPTSSSAAASDSPTNGKGVVAKAESGCISTEVSDSPTKMKIGRNEAREGFGKPLGSTFTSATAQDWETASSTVESRSGPTRPVSPKLLTKARGAHHAASSKVQRDEANAEEMKRQFKARPLDPRILEPGCELGVPKVLPKSPTTPIDIKLAINERFALWRTKESLTLETEVKAFKARPVPQSQYSPVSVAGQSSGRPSVRHPHPTSSCAAVSESPTNGKGVQTKFGGRELVEVRSGCGAIAVSSVEVGRSDTGEVTAKDWETASSTVESRSGPTRPVSPKLLTKARGAHHAASASPRKTSQEQLDEVNAEEMKRQFKARPLDPRILEPGCELGVPKVLPKSPTKPMNIKLAIDDRALSRQTKELPSLETEVKAFKARPLPTFLRRRLLRPPSVRLLRRPASSSAAVSESTGVQAMGEVRERVEVGDVARWRKPYRRKKRRQNIRSATRRARFSARSDRAVGRRVHKGLSVVSNTASIWTKRARASEPRHSVAPSTEYMLSFAESTEQFERDIRSHEVPKPHSGPTRPVSPKLLTKARGAHHAASAAHMKTSQEQRDEVDAEEMKRQFKARPLDPRIFEPGCEIGVSGVVMKSPTKPMDIKLATSDRFELRKTKESLTLETEVKAFKARPVPQSQYSPVSVAGQSSGRPSVRHPHPTSSSAAVSESTGVQAMGEVRERVEVGDEARRRKLYRRRKRRQNIRSATRRARSSARSDRAVNAAYIPTTRAKASESRHSLSDLDSRVAAQKAVGHAPSVEASPESRRTIAELIGRFERDIRSYEVPKPHSGPTRPVSPKLLTKARGAHHAASSKEQRYEADAEEMKRQFKARPLDPRILKPGCESGSSEVVPKSSTESMDMKHATSERSELRKSKGANLSASPVPTKSLQEAKLYRRMEKSPNSEDVSAFPHVRPVLEFPGEDVHSEVDDAYGAAVEWFSRSANFHGPPMDVCGNEELS